MSFIPPSTPDSPDPLVSFSARQDEDRPPLSPPTRRRGFRLHPHFGWAILWCIGMLMLTQVPGGIVAVVYIVFVMIFLPGLIDTNQLKTVPELMSNTQVQIGLGIGVWTAHFLMILLSLLVLRIAVGRDWPREVALRLPSLPHFWLVVLLTPAVIVLANGLYIFLRDKLGVPTGFGPNGADGTGDLEQLFNSWPLAIAVFLIGVMPGLSEELWCRAFLGRGLVGIHGYVAGVLMTSFLFGAIHVLPCQGIMAAVVGIVLHFVYLTTRSLIAPMLLHFFNNALSVIFSHFALKTFEPTGASEAFIYASAGLVLASVAHALYQSRARLVATDGGIPWQPPHPGVACPPAGSNTIVVAPMLSLTEWFMVLVTVGAFAAVLTVIGAGK